MISSKKELDFYIAADRMINRGTFKRSFKSKIKEIIVPDPIMEFLRTMRKLDFYSSSKSYLLAKVYYYRKF